MSDLNRVVHELHAKQRYVIETHMTEDNRIAWDMTVSGEDFLDGPWERKFQGVALKHHSVFQSIMRTMRRARR